MRRLPDDEALVNILYGDYRKCAKRREIKFSLSRDEFAELVFLDCFYCGRPPSNQIAGRNGDRFRPNNGVDRIHNTGGYESGNVMTACRWCNEAKRAKSYSEFVGWITGLASNLEKINDNCCD